MTKTFVELASNQGKLFVDPEAVVSVAETKGVIYVELANGNVFRTSETLANALDTLQILVTIP